ncbi:MAG: succinate dehydrogenase, cytochrome b556 subunit [Alphaproteobacteria bacterium]|nr:succinate dehydrogenase, cytochrome b556 subunit [Alphaproteobacteria bacterium]
MPMADNPQSPPLRSRPLSPFVTIYKWPITMATSIAHRVTGVAISLGMVLIAWGLIALASGPELYQPFTAAISNIVGQVVLFGFLTALVYHFLNGIRHLAWDLGYGFEVRTANRSGVLVIALSLLITAGVFGYCWWVLHGGPHA